MSFLKSSTQPDPNDNESIIDHTRKKRAEAFETLAKLNGEQQEDWLTEMQRKVQETLVEGCDNYLVFKANEKRKK